MAISWICRSRCIHHSYPAFIKLNVKHADMFSNFTHILYKYSTYSISKSTDIIREEFINYFKNHGHKFIRSSPVVPYCDPSVTFVNAGMNQFKSVFLGINPAPAPRAVNSQKCIRVGGRHNDLEVVGSDGYHHTFFEMLGSWSFGDYFKKDACNFSWELLTKVFGLDPKRLYVTYFGGEKNSGLEPDLETKEIWLEIGIPESHVLPFGAKENFWEMGPTGPCGPCTEMHYDFLGRNLASDRVNAGHPDLMELWNVVFIQYVRHEDGSLSPLPCKHVDTGMGLERLACVLQGVTSTYDTDIFQPLFNSIQKITGAPPYGGKFLVDDIHGTDTGYRILADHARMITVAIADGMLPDHNHRLRRVIRRALTVSEDFFLKGNNGHKLLYEICAHAAHSLEGAYPGIVPRLESIKAVLSHEEQMLHNLRTHSSSHWSKLISQWPQLDTLDVVSSPGMVRAFEELQALTRNGVMSIDEKMAFNLYDTFGLNEDVIQKLANTLGLHFAADSLAKQLEEVKGRSRKAGDITMQNQVLSPKFLAELNAHKIAATDDEFKYQYYKDDQGHYHFEPVVARIQAIVHKGKVFIDEAVTLENEGDFGLILDRTCFYNESGGQIADTGSITTINGTNIKIVVKDVQEAGGYIVHFGCIKMNPNKSQGLPTLQHGQSVELSINKEQRLKIMRNHTAVHCLGAALRTRLPATAQRSSFVSPSYLTYQFSAYGIPTLGKSDLGLYQDKNDPSVTESYSTAEVTSASFSWQELLKCVEGDVRKVVRSSSAPVLRRTLTGQQLLEEMAKSNCRLGEIATVPGEVYPESGVHLIEILAPAKCVEDISVFNESNEGKESTMLTWSREPCCGTHLFDATDIQEFSIVSVDSAGSGSRIVKAVTGSVAAAAQSKGKQLLKKVNELQKEVEDYLQNLKKLNLDGNKDVFLESMGASLEKKLKKLKSARVEGLSDPNWLENAISYVDSCQAHALLEMIELTLREHMRALSHSNVEQEMSAALAHIGSSGKFLVHWIQSGGTTSDKVLQKATKCCPTTLPVMVFTAIDGGKAVKARCVVPHEIATETFNAKLWMNPVMEIFKSSGKAPKGQNPHLVFNMKEKKLSTDSQQNKEKFELAVKKAKEFASQAISK